jgi:hypothetical protein
MYSLDTGQARLYSPSRCWSLAHPSYPRHTARVARIGEQNEAPTLRHTGKFVTWSWRKKGAQFAPCASVLPWGGPTALSDRSGRAVTSRTGFPLSSGMLCHRPPRAAWVDLTLVEPLPGVPGSERHLEPGHPRPVATWWFVSLLAQVWLECVRATHDDGVRAAPCRGGRSWCAPGVQDRRGTGSCRVAGQERRCSLLHSGRFAPWTMEGRLC